MLVENMLNAQFDLLTHKQILQNRVILTAKVSFSLPLSPTSLVNIKTNKLNIKNKVIQGQKC